LDLGTSGTKGGAGPFASTTNLNHWLATYDHVQTKVDYLTGGEAVGGGGDDYFVGVRVQNDDWNGQWFEISMYWVDDDDGSSSAMGEEEDLAGSGTTINGKLYKEYDWTNLSTSDTNVIAVLDDIAGDASDQERPKEGKVVYAMKPRLEQALSLWDEVQYKIDFNGPGDWASSSEDAYSIKLRAAMNKSETAKVFENQYDNSYHWTSNWHDIRDDRVQLSYQWTSNSHDVWGKRPRYETFEKQVPAVQTKTVTAWGWAPVSEDQSLLTGERNTDPGAAVPFGAFDGNSILATLNLSIESGADVSIQAGMKSERGSLSAHADHDLMIDGLTPSGATDPNTLPAIATLQASGLIELTAGRDVVSSEWSQLTVTGDGAAARISGGRNATVAAQVDATSEVLVRAGVDATLDGRITTQDLIDVAAGQGLGSVGSIHATDYAELHAGTS
ncbi:MAG TPA: hypothetical protein PLV92_24970, partial [Pirellulaceae bacterium]|nr:hypothetical protein [Pirellulaceae bacterium]